MQPAKRLWTTVLIVALLALPGVAAIGWASEGLAAQVGATPAGCQPDESLLLVQRLKPDLSDGFEPELSVVDSCGGEVRRIDLPGAAFVRPTDRSGVAIVHTSEGGSEQGDGLSYLVDAATGAVTQLAIPAFEPYLAYDAERRLVTMDSTRRMLVGHIDADPQIHLIDLATGASTDLLAGLPASLGEIGEIELAVLLPGDDHVYLDSWNGPFVIPVADPARAYRVGEPDEVANASLAPDGTRVVYTRNTTTGTEESVLTGIDLASPEVVASIPSTKAANELFARYLGDGSILFESPERAWILDPTNGAEETLPPGDEGGCGPIDNWFPAPSGEAITYSLETGGCGEEEPRPQEWWHYDRKTGEGRPLSELDGYDVGAGLPLAGTGYPGLLPSSIRQGGASPDQAWVILVPDADGETVADVSAARRLDLATGAVTAIPDLPAGAGFFFTVPSPNGNSAALTLLSDQIEGETFLYDVKTGAVERVDETAIGRFSPTGEWLALTAYEPTATGLQTRLSVRRLADGATFDLGDGIATWLAP